MRRRELLAGAMLAATTGPASAQHAAKAPRIAIVVPSGSTALLNEAGSPRYFRPFFEELRRLGHVEGQNLVVQRYSGEEQTGGYAALARTVVGLNPDAIFVVTSRMAADFKAATTTIPIVAVTVNPIVFGLTVSLARPGGNITGVVADAGFELEAKRLQLLTQAVPTASSIAYLTPRALWQNPPAVAIRAAARQAGVALLPALLDDPAGEAEYRRVFAALAQARAQALVVGGASENIAQAPLIRELAESARLPTIFPDRSFVEHGGLMSYGVDYPDLYRHAADDIDAILKGTKPAEIPFYRATDFELVINLGAARALRIAMPALLLVRASEVIE